MILPPQIAAKPLKHIDCILPRTDLEGGLYLGDIVCLRKPDLLRSNNIEAVLSCIGSENPCISYSISAQKVIFCRDEPGFNISTIFSEAISFIDEQRKKGLSVLVHCHAGVSRSATVVCAYLVKNLRITAEDALAFVKSKRERIRPNQGFLRQLNEYAAQQAAQDQQNLTKKQPQAAAAEQQNHRYEQIFTEQDYGRQSNNFCDFFLFGLFSPKSEGKPKVVVRKSFAGPVKLGSSSKKGENANIQNNQIKPFKSEGQWEGHMVSREKKPFRRLFDDQCNIKTCKSPQ